MGVRGSFQRHEQLPGFLVYVLSSKQAQELPGREDLA